MSWRSSRIVVPILSESKVISRSETRRVRRSKMTCVRVYIEIAVQGS